MFDTSVEIDAKGIAKALTVAAAVALPPVRIQDGDKVHYIRPSNVLRIKPGYENGYKNTITAEIETTEGEPVRFTVLSPDDVARAFGWQQGPTES